LYNKATKTLIERKTQIKQIYLGYKYQVWAQYLCMTEMGFPVKQIILYSLKDNKSYSIPLPTHQDIKEFENFLEKYKNFDVNNFKQTNIHKCEKCIYKNLCNN
jgi:CRISPR-associated protein Cas4